jgi:hypothetical protein
VIRRSNGGDQSQHVFYGATARFPHLIQRASYICMKRVVSSARYPEICITPL